MRADKARRMRRLIEALADHLEDGEALEAAELFRVWNGCHRYGKGQRVRHKGKLYRCLKTHDAQPKWVPGNCPDLWIPVGGKPCEQGEGAAQNGVQEWEGVS